MTMPAGRYAIIDLCYVMHDVWNEFCDLTFKGERRLEGEFTLADGRRFASFGTAYGDGTYCSNIGTRHSVDAGLIGCIRVEDIQDKTYDLERIMQLGAIVDFEQPFEVEADYGLLKFGHVLIETAADEEEYEEEEV
jgi:hypothetical protein